MPRTRFPELRDSETRKALGEVLAILFDRWGVREQHKAALLGLPIMTFDLGQDPLPDDPQIMEHVGHLLAIDRGLSDLCPDTPGFSERWVTTPQVRFDGESPLDFMVRRGIKGIQEVRRFIESEVNPDDV